MKPMIDLNLWNNLVLDTCPNCQTQGLLMEDQGPVEAILTCKQCGSRYWMSAIRQKGAYQLLSSTTKSENKELRQLEKV